MLYHDRVISRCVWRLISASSREPCMCHLYLNGFPWATWLQRGVKRTRPPGTATAIFTRNTNTHTHTHTHFKRTHLARQTFHTDKRALWRRRHTAQSAGKSLRTSSRPSDRVWSPPWRPAVKYPSANQRGTNWDDVDFTGDDEVWSTKYVVDSKINHLGSNSISFGSSARSVDYEIDHAINKALFKFDMGLRQGYYNKPPKKSITIICL